MNIEKILVILLFWTEFIIFNVIFIMFLPENLRIGIIVWIICFMICIAYVVCKIQNSEEHERKNSLCSMW